MGTIILHKKKSNNGKSVSMKTKRHTKTVSKKQHSKSNKSRNNRTVCEIESIAVKSDYNVTNLEAYLVMTIFLSDIKSTNVKKMCIAKVRFIESNQLLEHKQFFILEVLCALSFKNERFIDLVAILTYNKSSNFESHREETKQLINSNCNSFIKRGGGSIKAYAINKFLQISNILSCGFFILSILGGFSNFTKDCKEFNQILSESRFKKHIENAVNNFSVVDVKDRFIKCIDDTNYMSHTISFVDGVNNDNSKLYHNLFCLGKETSNSVLNFITNQPSTIDNMKSIEDDFKSAGSAWLFKNVLSSVNKGVTMFTTSLTLPASSSFSSINRFLLVAEDRLAQDYENIEYRRDIMESEYKLLQTELKILNKKMARINSYAFNTLSNVVLPTISFIFNGIIREIMPVTPPSRLYKLLPR